MSESPLLHIEGHEDAVDKEHEIVGVDTVEHVVVEEERQLSLHSVRLANLANLIYLFLSYHQFFTRLMLAPRALRRASMSS